MKWRLSSIVALPWVVELKRENKIFFNSLDYFHLIHKNSHVCVRLLCTADFQQRLTNLFINTPCPIYKHGETGSVQ